MNESELVDGAEYEGTGVLSSSTRRGIFVRVNRARAGRVIVDLDCGLNVLCSVWLGTLRPVSRASPTLDTANDLAQAIHDEAAKAEEKKRRHYEERCAAYAKQSDDNGHSHRVSPEIYAAQSGIVLDRAIARVQPKRDDGPAYVSKAWPEDSEYDGQV